MKAAYGGEKSTNGKRKAPVSVLDRPWDVEILLHGERRVITVQPGDSVLEAVSFKLDGVPVLYPEADQARCGLFYLVCVPIELCDPLFFVHTRLTAVAG